ncbi:atherin-like [Falco peregrinus]|uniref:atherin-like n=1 Tax=Falco peregrinus TaxID=8954 RepID=UPI00247A8470|nr:atherin-like [Falco peregrinus]
MLKEIVPKALLKSRWKHPKPFPHTLSGATRPQRPTIHCSSHSRREYHTPLAPTAQEAVKELASPLFSKQGTAAQTGSQAPAPHSPTAHTVALQDAAWWDMSDVLHELEAVIQERSQQPVEQRHSAQSMDAAMAVKPRAATEDSESTLAAEPRGEPSTASPVPDERQDGEHMASPMSGDPPGEASAAIVSPAAHDHEGAFLLPENAVDNTATPHLAPAAENGDNETACPLPWEPWHQVSQGRVASTEHPQVPEAGAAPGACVAGTWLVDILSISSPPPPPPRPPPPPLVLLSPCRRPPSTEATRSPPLAAGP